MRAKSAARMEGAMRTACCMGLGSRWSRAVMSLVSVRFRARKRGSGSAAGQRKRGRVPRRLPLARTPPAADLLGCRQRTLGKGVWWPIVWADPLEAALRKSQARAAGAVALGFPSGLRREGAMFRKVVTALALALVLVLQLPAGAQANPQQKSEQRDGQSRYEVAPYSYLPLVLA